MSWWVRICVQTNMVGGMTWSFFWWTNPILHLLNVTKKIETPGHRCFVLQTLINRFSILEHIDLTILQVEWWRSPDVSRNLLTNLAIRDLVKVWPREANISKMARSSNVIYDRENLMFFKIINVDCLKCLKQNLQCTADVWHWKGLDYLFNFW